MSSEWRARETEGQSLLAFGLSVGGWGWPVQVKKAKPQPPDAHSL